MATLPVGWLFFKKRAKPGVGSFYLESKAKRSGFILSLAISDGLN